MEFDIDEAIDDQNWKKESSVSLRFTSENDLDEIFNLIQTVGKEMNAKIMNYLHIAKILRFIYEC